MEYCINTIQIKNDIEISISFSKDDLTPHADLDKVVAELAHEIEMILVDISFGDIKELDS